MTDETPDVDERVESFETGYKLSVKSVRGTGTRDQDTVRAELKTEQPPTEADREALRDRVVDTMAELRAFDPDGGDL